MKALQKIAILVLSATATILPSLAQAPVLPDSGTYFIVSADNEEALEADAASVGQNVHLKEFNKNGLQKWTIARKVDIKTKKPTNRYNIRLAGETTDLNLQPHPVSTMSAILNPDASVLALEADETGILVKSVPRNGDALYILKQPPGYTESHFGPNDGTAKFRWNFIPAN